MSLSKNQVRTIHGTDQSPGAGGWPTVRHFNKQTGYGGEAYKQKTDTAMCDELGPKQDYMKMHIEEASGSSLCNVHTSEGCSDQQKKFIEKWTGKANEELTKQIDRLKGMVDKDGASMKPEALTWAKQRLAIVTQMHKAAPKDEL